jgi:GntR family transcriptional regulator/MocR family aminotransferase
MKPLALDKFTFPIDRRSSEPVFRQIVNHLHGLIASGELEPGTRMPPTRALADLLKVNRTTVIAAYDALGSLGYLGATVGSGTYVRPGPENGDHSDSEANGEVDGDGRTDGGLFGRRFRQFSRGVDQMARFPRRERVATDHPEPVDFATLFPDEEFFPVDNFRKIVNRLLMHRGREVLQYASPEGDPNLREAIARELTRSGATTSAEDIVIVNGTQQGLDLILRLFVDAGDRVAIESPTYWSILPALGFYGARLCQIPMTPTGMDVDALATAIAAERPKLLYTMPSFHNPTGLTLSLEKRRALLDLVRRHEVAVIEDDYEKDLCFTGNPLPSLKALDPKGLIMHLGSFSKGLFPGLRLGYIVAPHSVVERLVLLKRYSDLHTSSLTQAAVAEFLAGGHYRRHLEKLQVVYRQRRDCVLAALERHFPKEATWTRPDGGYALWVTLPAGVDAGELLAAAGAEGVIFTPGSYFFATDAAENGFRLSIARADRPEIERGIEVLARLIRERLGRTRQSALPHV